MTYKDILPLVRKNDEKILLILLGGVGGIQSGPNLLTELQQAHRPHLNALARKSACGLLLPVAPGVTPAADASLRRLLGWEEEQVPSWTSGLGLASCALSSSPEYLALCTQAGINAIASPGEPSGLVERACTEILEHDLIILHYAAPEKEGRAGGYYEKIKAIEDFDRLIPQLLESTPAVVAVCGDHSCPSALGVITWHPVPLLIHALTARYDMVQTYDEIACTAGTLGTLRSAELLPLLLAHAGKLAPAR